MTRRHSTMLAVCLVVAGLGWAVANVGADSGNKSPRVPPEGVLRLQATTLPDAAGQATPIAEWKGKILIVNFWATWCSPCRKEMPAFSRLHAKLAEKGVQFVGIGIDSPSAIKEFAFQTPVSYPLLVSGSEGLDLIRALGNQVAALPYTVVLDRKGKAVFSRLGLVDEAELEKLLDRLLAA